MRTIPPLLAVSAALMLFLYDRQGKKARSFIGETPTKDLKAAIEKLF